MTLYRTLHHTASSSYDPLPHTFHNTASYSYDPLPHTFHTITSYAHAYSFVLILMHSHNPNTAYSRDSIPHMTSYRLLETPYHISWPFNIAKCHITISYCSGQVTHTLLFYLGVAKFENPVPVSILY